MRTSLLLVLTCTLIGLCLALPEAPSGAAGGTPTSGEIRAEAGGEWALANGRPCRILVEGGADTRLNRGTLPRLDETTILVGTYRYWTEPAGPVLYVWDDVQNLTARILKPAAVRIVPD